MTEEDVRVADEGDETLEARLRRLDEILARLEAGDAELDEALRLFEEGVGHVRRAEEILARAELRVEELLADGSTVPIESPGGGDAP